MWRGVTARYRIREVDSQCNLAQKEGNKRRVQADAAAEKKNAVGEWLELLASQDDAAWKENLIGMGSAPNVPKLFHNNGKVTSAGKQGLPCQQRITNFHAAAAHTWSRSNEPVSALSGAITRMCRDTLAAPATIAKLGIRCVP